MSQLTVALVAPVVIRAQPQQFVPLLHGALAGPSAPHACCQNVLAWHSDVQALFVFGCGRCRCYGGNQFQLSISVPRPATQALFLPGN
jgi:hypothetical protein